MRVPAYRLRLICYNVLASDDNRGRMLRAASNARSRVPRTRSEKGERPSSGGADGPHWNCTNRRRSWPACEAPSGSSRSECRAGHGRSSWRAVVGQGEPSPSAGTDVRLEVRVEVNGLRVAVGSAVPIDKRIVSTAIARMGIGGRPVAAHSSLKALGVVVGGASAVVGALQDRRRTVLVPAFSSGGLRPMRGRGCGRSRPGTAGPAAGPAH